MTAAAVGRYATLRDEMAAAAVGRYATLRDEMRSDATSWDLTAAGEDAAGAATTRTGGRTNENLNGSE